MGELGISVSNLFLALGLLFVKESQQCSEMIKQQGKATNDWRVYKQCNRKYCTHWSKWDYIAEPGDLVDWITIYLPYKTRVCRMEMVAEYDTSDLTKEIPIDVKIYSRQYKEGYFDNWKSGEYTKKTEFTMDYSNWKAGGYSRVYNLQLDEDYEMTAIKFKMRTYFDGNSEEFEIKERNWKYYFAKKDYNGDGYHRWNVNIRNIKVYKRDQPIIFTPEVSLQDVTNIGSGFPLGRYTELECLAYSYFASEDFAHNNLVLDFNGRAIERDDENRKLTVEGGSNDYLVSKRLTINALRFQDTGTYTCTVTENSGKTATSSVTLSYVGQDPGAVTPQMFLENEQAFISAKPFWAGSGSVSTSSLIAAAENICSQSGGHTMDSDDVERLVSYYREDKESDDSSKALQTVLDNLSGKQCLYVNDSSTDQIGCLTSDDLSFGDQDCWATPTPSAAMCLYNYGHYYSIVGDEECQYQDVNSGLRKKFTVKIVGNQEWDMKCIVRKQDTDVVNASFYETLQSGESISVVFDTMQSIPFGSRVTCGTGPQNNDDPDDSHPTASFTIPEPEPPALTRTIEHRGVISQIQIDTDDEVSGVGNYYSSGYFLCKVSGYPLPSITWNVAKIINGTEVIAPLDASEDPYMRVSFVHNQDMGETACGTFHYVSSLYFVSIFPEHSQTYICSAEDPIAKVVFYSQRISLFGLQSEFASNITYSIKDFSYTGRVAVTGPPMPTFGLYCRDAIAWRTYTPTILNQTQFLYEAEFFVYGAHLGGGCVINIFNGFGVPKSKSGDFTQALGEVKVEYVRSTRTIKCYLYTFPIRLENLVPSCSAMQLIRNASLPDVKTLSGIYGATYRTSEPIPDLFSSCSCTYTSMAGDIIEAIIEIPPSSHDRTDVKLRPVLHTLQDAINTVPQIYEKVPAETMAVSIDRVLQDSHFSFLTTAEIIEVAKVMTYASKAPVDYEHTAGYSAKKVRIGKVRSSGFAMARAIADMTVSSRLNFEEKRELHQALLHFSSHIVRQYRKGESFYEKLGPVAIHAKHLRTDYLKDVVISQETENGKTKGIINAVAISNTTLKNIIPQGAQSVTLVVIFTDSKYLPKSPQKTKPEVEKTIRKNQYQVFLEAQSINSGILQVYLEIDQFYKSIPVEFKLNQRDSEKDTRRESDEEPYEMRVQSICVYYQVPTEERVGIWSEQGCETVAERSNPSQTYCKCSHTTMFAINSLVNENKIDPFVPSEYRIISYVGSNVALVINIANFILQLNVDRVMTNEQNKVHYLLVQTVVFFQLVYLVGVERKDIPAVCKATAFILQNCMLMAFCWNFCVGLYLLNRVKKFIVGKVLLRFGIFNLISWGYPALISVIFYILFKDLYGRGVGCYIEMGNFWPVFYVPRVPIFIGNISCLLTVIWALKKKKIKIKKSLRKQILYSVKGELVVIPTIQLTFLFCAQGMQSRNVVFQIGNGLSLVVLSVVLFFYTTLLNPEFWEARAKIRQRDSHMRKFNMLRKWEDKVQNQMEKLKKRKKKQKSKYKQQVNEGDISGKEAQGNIPSAHSLARIPVVSRIIADETADGVLADETADAISANKTADEVLANETADGILTNDTADGLSANDDGKSNEREGAEQAEEARDETDSDDDSDANNSDTSSERLDGVVAEDNL